MKIIKKILFYKIDDILFIAILTFLLDIAIVNVDKLGSPKYKLHIVSITSLSSIAMILFNKKYKIRWISELVNFIGASIFCLSLMLFAAGILKVTPGPYTDVKLYSKIFTNGESYISEMEHFPREIPENAEELEMRYWRELLQGRGYFWLKYKTNAEEIEELKKEYPFMNVITRRFLDTLQSMDYFENNPFYSYNISYNSGIAFNNSTNEVFYWFYVE